MYSATLALVLGCMPSSYGDDPLGESLKLGADPVKVAIEHFEAENQRYPESLSELVDSEAVKTLEDMQLWYSQDQESYVLSFAYMHPRHGGYQVICRTFEGFEGWACGPFK